MVRMLLPGAELSYIADAAARSSQKSAMTWTFAAIVCAQSASAMKRAGSPVMR